MNVGKPTENMEMVNEPAEIRGLLNPVKLIDKATSDDELAIVRKGRESGSLQKLRSAKHGKVFATGHRRMDFERRV